MQLFFSSLNSLESFIYSLNLPSSNNSCDNCSKCNQWVSHGFVYKQRSTHQQDVIGKRILCSRRYDRVGCGRTKQLYLDHRIPQRQYDLCTVLAFIASLLKGLSVNRAYNKACNNPLKDARHGWRWLHALTHQLGRFRLLVGRATDTKGHESQHPSRRLRILLPTLNKLLQRPCELGSIQYLLQHPFL